ncbi:hypothetical protein D9756_009898 [Leucocoprinus leucothites]|uniref:Pali-domain-containing protein n=1 Tax=Leucocoprinus leucothites TaxID=201217 RepID=A0A8H5FRV9_9AGAR|nr:hypothetical protein D9756_009898 [Leucoagaricus leucothites]
MARLFCIPGSVLLFAAFVLNLIVTISLPYLPALDVTRTHFDSGALYNGNLPMTELRFGIWTRCFYNNERDHTCPPLGYAYNVRVSDADRSNEVEITPPWTRGLALHPIATIVSLLAFALALSEHVTVALAATLTAWLASLLTFTAFIIDLILFGWSKHQFGKIDIGAHAATAPGTWVTFVAFIILFIGGLGTCCGRISDRRAQRKATDAAAAETAHTRDTTAATATTEDKAETEKAGSVGAAEGTSKAAGKSGWASKFKFGKKAQA